MVYGQIFVPNLVFYFSEVPAYLGVWYDVIMKKVTIFSAIHGDEVYGIELYESFIEKYPGLKDWVRLTIGNKKANNKKVRFIDTDMNRAYGVDDVGHEAVEIARVEDELEQFTPDYIFDVHTTRRSSGVFYITDSLNSPKYEICSKLDIDVLIMKHGYVNNSFVGTHHKAVSLEYSLNSISSITTSNFIDGIAELIIGDMRSKILNRRIFELRSIITKEQFNNYSNLKSYDEKPEGTALMVPKDESEMDAEYFGFWCKNL